MHAAAASAGSAAGSPGSGLNEQLANNMAASGYGWTGSQLTCLDELWTEESGFSAYAANPTSDARGIPQNIRRLVGWLPAGQRQPADRLGAFLHRRPVRQRRAPPGPSKHPTSRTGTKPRPEGGPQCR